MNGSSMYSLLKYVFSVQGAYAGYGAYPSYGPPQQQAPVPQQAPYGGYGQGYPPQVFWSSRWKTMVSEWFVMSEMRCMRAGRESVVGMLSVFFLVDWVSGWYDWWIVSRRWTVGAQVDGEGGHSIITCMLHTVWAFVVLLKWSLWGLVCLPWGVFGVQ